MQTHGYTPPKTTSKTVVIVVIVIIIIAVGGGIAGGLYFYLSQPQPQNAANLQSVDFVFSPTSLIVGQAVQFTPTVTGGSAPYGYAWKFGDGSSSGMNNPSHMYMASGRFTISLVVTDSAIPSRTGSASHGVTVSSSSNGGMTIAESGPQTGTVGSSVSFTAYVTGGAPAYNFAWTATGGSPSSASGPGFATRYSGFTTTYNTAGSYTVSVSVTDVNGVRATGSSSIVISNPSGTGSGQPIILTYYQAPEFSMFLPQGWQGSSGQRQGYLVPGFSLFAHNAAGDQSIFYSGADRYFVDSASTTPSGTTLGREYGAGTICPATSDCAVAPGYLIYPFITATDYVNQVLTMPCRNGADVLCNGVSPTHNPTVSTTIAKVTDRPNLIGHLSNWFELTCGPSVNGHSPITSAASATLSYTLNGVPYQAGVLVEICPVTFTIPGSFGFSTATYRLFFSAVAGYTTPTADAASMVATYRKVMPTLVLNFQWASNVVAQMAQQEAVINSAIQQWQAADQQMFAITLGPSAADGWIDALDGVNTGTANGYTYKIPSGYSYAWVTNPGSSSADMCLANGPTLPSGCPSGSVPVTFTSGTYSHVSPQNNLSPVWTVPDPFLPLTNRLFTFRQRMGILHVNQEVVSNNPIPDYSLSLSDRSCPSR